MSQKPAVELTLIQPCLTRRSVQSVLHPDRVYNYLCIRNAYSPGAYSYVQVVKVHLHKGFTDIITGNGISMYYIFTFQIKKCVFISPCTNHNYAVRPSLLKEKPEQKRGGQQVHGDIILIADKQISINIRPSS